MFDETLALPVLRLVRHARPMLPFGTCYGATDVVADPQHTAQVAAMLIQTLPEGASLLSSPLQRCAALAQAVVAGRTDLRLRFEPRIVEMNFGCWEGARWDAIPAAAFDAWTAEFGSHRFGGAENVQTLMKRVAAVWDECGDASRPQVWITHAGVMAAAALLARGIRSVDQADEWPRASPEYGAVVSLPLGRLASAAGGQD
jgi:alpha-ribazole phosphatase